MAIVDEDTIRKIAEEISTFCCNRFLGDGPQVSGSMDAVVESILRRHLQSEREPEQSPMERLTGRQSWVQESDHLLGKVSMCEEQARLHAERSESLEESNARFLAATLKDAYDEIIRLRAVISAGEPEGLREVVERLDRVRAWMIGEGYTQAHGIELSGIADRLRSILSEREPQEKR